MFNLRLRNHFLSAFVKLPVKYNIHCSLFLLACFYLTSCKYTKHLSQNQTLLRENSVVLKTDKPQKYKGEKESIILSLVSPKANTRLFDLSFLPKYKLWRYNNRYQYYERNPTDSKILKHKVEKPSLLDTSLVIRSQNYIKQYMDNMGYFYATVDYTIRPIREKLADVVYTVHAGKNYVIRNVTTHSKSQAIREIIEANAAETLLIPGDPYTKINCGLERERLYKIIRDQGFFDFKSDNISFTIDTSDKAKLIGLLDDPFSHLDTKPTISDHKTIDVNLHVGQSRDSTFDQLYTIKRVKVILNAPDNEQNRSQPETHNELDHIHFYYKTLPVNRKVVARNIFIHEGDLYSTHNYELTINRLNQLGIFQLVNIHYDKIRDSTGQLECVITLNSSPKMDLVGLLDISTSDDDYLLGTGVGITFRNKNLAHGANLLSIRTSYSTEFRNDPFLTGEKKFYQSGNNVNVSTQLTFPKFIVPFNQNVFNKKNMPYTILGINYSLIQRVQNYTILNLSGNFGYTWQETIKKSWKVNPIFLTVTKVPDKYLSADFIKRRESNSYLKNTFSNSVIQGENMLFEYRSRPSNQFANFSSVKIGLEESGSLLTLINSVYMPLARDTIKNIAHYVKADVDARRYVNRRKSQWVNRFMLGVGVPIGKSRTLPYIKQFSAGGAFSNRGWQSRRLGPGHSADTAFASGFAILDKTGDIKLEANTEYRFNLLKLFSGAINLKGAFFIDAGNIWLMNKDSTVKGGEFSFRYLWQDIGMSAGTGLRLDFSFFVFRVDIGYPFKQPSLLQNNGFAFDRLRWNSGLWNLAFGYPF